MAGGILSSELSGELGVTSAVIADGQSLSGAIDLKAQRLHQIMLPAGFASADLTFQVSVDETNWMDLFDADGEYKIPAAAVAASRSILVDVPTFFGIRYLKIRSGTSGAPSAVSGDKTLTLSTTPR